MSDRRAQVHSLGKIRRYEEHADSTELKNLDTSTIRTTPKGVKRHVLPYVRVIEHANLFQYYYRDGVWVREPSRGAFEHHIRFPNTGEYYTRAYAKAYDECLSHLRGENFELGMNIATMGQSLSMLEHYTLKVVNLIRFYRKGDLTGLRSVIGTGKRARKVRKRLRSASEERLKADFRKWRRGARDFSDEFLIVRYGLSPLMSDLESACRLIDEPVQWTRRIIGKGKETYTYTVRRPNGTNIDYHFEVKVLVGATFTVDNPNVALRNKLGILSPWKIINDLIPWSFVVNWFTGHEAWLQSLDGFAGWKFMDPWVNSRYVWAMSGILRFADATESPKSTYYAGSRQGMMFARDYTSLQRPTLRSRMKIAGIDSIGRAANAFALAVSTLFRRS